jgi:hypothetical protein
VARDELVLPLPGRDRKLRDYVVPPVTAGELFDLLSLGEPWERVGQRRAERIAGGPVPETQWHALMLPLGPVVSDAMFADGVSRAGYGLAAATVMQWIFSGSEAATELWTSGQLPNTKGPPTAEELEQYVITRSRSGEALEYAIPDEVRARMHKVDEGDGIRLSQLWGEPDLLEVDLHAIYGFDVAVDGDSRSGPWLRRRVETLLLHPSSMLGSKIEGDRQREREGKR